jgi:hypothetical protein
MTNNSATKKIVILLLISFPIIVFAQNVGIGTTAPVTKLNIAGGGSSPAIPGATSTALFRIGIGTAEGIDFGKMGSSPFSAWMQAGLNGAVPDPLSLQPIGGNVGIGTISPAEKLDVSGNINITGTIKANGVDGTANQILMKNGSGTLAWGDMCEYKNMESFLFTTLNAIQLWTIPAGVTKIAVETWGGGGSANSENGGGGGGYLYAILTVTPASSVSIIVGKGGTLNTGEGGTGSSVSYGAILVGAQGSSNPTPSSGGLGGNIFVTPSTFRNYTGFAGESGRVPSILVNQLPANENFYQYKYGSGGNAGNTHNTGGEGGMRAFKDGVFVIYGNYQGNAGAFPGGGGGASSVSLGAAGANGFVVIHY